MSFCRLRIILLIIFSTILWLLIRFPLEDLGKSGKEEDPLFFVDQIQSVYSLFGMRVSLLDREGRVMQSNLSCFIVKHLRFLLGNVMIVLVSY